MTGLSSNSSNRNQKAAPQPAATVSSRPLDADRQAQHLLNRITFGPRPGDLERVRAMGVQAFLKEQLHAERLDDSASEARLKILPTLSMSTGELIEKYPQPKPGAADPTPVVRQAPDSMKADGAEPMSSASMAQTGAQTGAQAGNEPREILLELGREQLLRAVYSRRQLDEVMVQFWMNHFNVFAAKGQDKWMLTSFERDTIRPHALGKFEDLLVATAKSPAMLFYLDNWLSAAPDSQAYMARRFAFGGPFRRFGPEMPANSGIAGNAQAQKRGLNENYGRELMELHTLGVDGGYTQQDVIEVARCLTGWTIQRPRYESEFFFNPRLHDEGSKTVLGHRIAAGGGMDDGLQVLHILATHPSTARFVSLKLCRRFVADEPPAGLVDRASRQFMQTHGDLRAVLETIVNSPEFYSEEAYRAKVKSPFEMVASTLRALDAETDAGPVLLALMGRMGEPMFLYQSPAGFPDRTSTWIGSSTLLARLNFASLVASNRIPGTQIKLGPASSGADGQSAGPGGDQSAPASPGDFVDELNARLTGGTLTARSRNVILKSLQSDAENAPGQAPESRGPYDELATAAALVIGSPEFQWR
jgi:uncharacterized protein (DUF1800 family)